MMENFAAATAAMAGGGSANGGSGEVSKPEGPEANGQAGGTSALPQQPAAAASTAAATTGGANNSGSSTTTTQQTQPYPGSTLNVHPFLSSMVIYTQPMKFQGFDVAEEENLAFKMSSFPETTALGKKNK